MSRTSLRVKAKEEKGRECGKVWDTGVPNKPIDDPYPAFFKPSTNCTYNVGGQIVYIQYPTDRQKIIDYIHRVERFDQTTLLKADNGIYTWILYKKKDDPNIYFASARAKSIVEMGTLHFAVARGVEASTIHGAGELKKVGDEIIFNFLSGSFMKNWISGKNPLCELPEMEMFIRNNYLEPMFPRTKISFTKATFIEKYYLKVPTMEEIQSYADEGFVVCVHPKDKKDECKSVKGTCAAPLKPREGTTMAKIGGNENEENPSTKKETSQAKKARQVFVSQGILKPVTQKEKAIANLGVQIHPQAVGLGRRKTKKTKRLRRKTQRKSRA